MSDTFAIDPVIEVRVTFDTGEEPRDPVHVGKLVIGVNDPTAFDLDAHVRERCYALMGLGTLTRTALQEYTFRPQDRSITWRACLERIAKADGELTALQKQLYYAGEAEDGMPVLSETTPDSREAGLQLLRERFPFPG